MTTQEQLEFFKEYQKKSSAYGFAYSTLYFDMTTVAPKDGNAYRAEMMSILAGEDYSYSTNPDNVGILEELAQKEELDPITKKGLQELLKQIHKDSCIPKEEFVQYSLLINQASSAWEKAKYDDNYEEFKPHLQKIIDSLKRNVAYRKENKSIYSSLLDDFESGITMEKYDQLFQLIKDKLIPFIHKLQTEGKQINDDIFKLHYPAKEQALFAKDILDYFQADERQCYMGESEHPYTMKLSAHDARITTHYEEDNLMASIFSVIHEYGHALYGLQVDEKYEGTIFSDHMGMGIHESQSRLMENHIGKSPALWENLFPKLQGYFPEQLGTLTFDEFMEKVNVSRSSLIRIHADELTYPLHVLIRYEIEKELIDGSLDTKGLEELWNQKYQEYLGITVSNAKEGVLQDSHWSNGNFGYFPSYVLGSAYAAQFFHKMEEDMDVETILRKGEFQKIAQWLKENIHQYGSFLTSEEVLKKVTGEDFNPNYYVDHLINKFTKIYLK